MTPLKTIKVQVTDDDIKKGIIRNCSQCPVANAIIRTTGIIAVSVGAYSACIEYSDVLAGYYTLPDDATDRIRVFDYTGRMDPFEFELEIDDD